MSRSMAVNQIEQQIEALTPVEQIMMIERIVHHLKQLLLTQPATATPLKECKEIAEKLNQVYKTTTRLDSQLINAQCTSVSRDEW